MFRLNKPLLCLFFFLTLSLRAFAEDGLYALTEIDYFDSKGIKKTEKKEIQATIDKKEPPLEQELWIEPAMSADGKVSYYKPPQVVVDFLDDPTTENGKKYIEWNQKKLAKIQKAQTVLQELAKEMNLIPPTIAPQVQDVPLPKTTIARKGTAVIFFLLKGCQYCEKQKALIMDLFKNRPELHVEVYAKNYTDDEIKELPFPAKQDAGMSRQFGLNIYPSVFVANQYGKKMIVPGLIDDAAFETLLVTGKK